MAMLVSPQLPLGGFVADVQTFWFMQSALHDLTPTRISNPRPFNICQRVLHRCHEILFGDPPEPSRNPYRSLPTSPHASSPSVGHIGRPSSAAPFMGREPSLPPDERLNPPVRVNANLGAALVGMGLIAAGAPAMPQFTALAGEWAVTQGRRPLDDAAASRARIEVDTQGGADGPRGDAWDRKQKQISAQESDSDDESAASAPDAPTKISRRPTPPQRSATAQPEASSSPNRPPMVNHVSTTALNMLSQEEDQRGRDPFMQNTSTPPLSSVFRKQTTHQPFHSVPDMSLNRSLGSGRSANRPPSAESLLAAYSLAAQRQLLKSHYTRSEIRFLLLLEDICNRLLVIPKPARISALRAELTSLNHNLPAEVCMPLWCNADHHRNEDPTTTSFLGKPKQVRRAHSRVVRISPGDSVVLNSAERAPYLLHVEILVDDLDFEPTKRENRELLKKIVVAEDLKRRKKEEGFEHHVPEGFGSAMPAPLSASALGGDSATESPAHSRSQSHSRAETGDAIGTPIEEIPEGPEEPEEMDLVEQLFGNKLSVRDNMVDLSESMPLPAAPKNKQLDLEVWNKEDQSRRSSLGSAGGSGTPNGELNANPEGLAPRPITPVPLEPVVSPRVKPVITMEDYSERMRTAAVMLAQLNASLVPPNPEHGQSGSSGVRKWIPGTGWITGSNKETTEPAGGAAGGKLRLAAAEAARIRERIMEEMMALEEERVSRMAAIPEGVHVEQADGTQTVEDEGIVRREINKADPSAAVFKESWAAKKSRIRASSPWGHLANWDVISVIVKTGADLRQEQLATQLIERFTKIWTDEGCECWARFFRILITGETSGLVETVTDAVSVHSIKKSEYSRRVASGTPIGHVSLLDHFISTYGKPDSGQFARARRNFIKSLAGYSVITYLLQIKDRHNGNILVDRDGHVIHIDFGFMLSNSPGGNIGFEAAPFKLPLEYIDIMGGFDSAGFELFRKLFKQGFEAARKHSDSLVTMVELMQKDSKLDCFVLFGENTVNHFRERFCLGLTTAAVDQYLDRLIVSSAGSNYTRLYDTFQYYSQGVL